MTTQLMLQPSPSPAPTKRPLRRLAGTRPASPRRRIQSSIPLPQYLTQFPVSQEKRREKKHPGLEQQVRGEKRPPTEDKRSQTERLAATRPRREGILKKEEKKNAAVATREEGRGENPRTAKEEARGRKRPATDRGARIPTGLV